MTAANNGRPLPWHDTPKCQRPRCGGPMVPIGSMANGWAGPPDSRIACSACGTAVRGTKEEVAQARRADRAFEAWNKGGIYEDRGCERCNGALPLDRMRLCVTCVEKDNAWRQESLPL